ncbi:hypothetical protein [uncultured Spirosoma sp.]|uniref:hypothetical protein n=1 Tax=uncultured Spirosoma sp. TaxID=278208 RepID=UPI00258C4C0F|nr:hypothetical protein [uncultured Spirosoma sp.]
MMSISLKRSLIRTPTSAYGRKTARPVYHSVKSTTFYLFLSCLFSPRPAGEDEDYF